MTITKNDKLVAVKIRKTHVDMISPILECVKEFIPEVFDKRLEHTAELYKSCQDFKAPVFIKGFKFVFAKE